MLQITPQMRILVAVEAVEFRKGIDSLAELCRAKLQCDPFSGCMFVFRSRRATSIKVLVYDGQGFWLATKRLSKAVFRWQAPERNAEPRTWTGQPAPEIRGSLQDAEDRLTFCEAQAAQAKEQHHLLRKRYEDGA